MRKMIAGLLLTVVLSACVSEDGAFDVNKQLDYCVAQTKLTLNNLPNDTLMPRNISRDNNVWQLVDIDDWTSGFWPGILWYAYEYSRDESLKRAADHYTRLLTPLSERAAYDHDIGFQIFCSFGNGYRIAGIPEYKAIILRSADTLATLFNPNVGTILSWPRMVQQKNWPHNTIIDNMINLEMLFWASKNGGDSVLYKIADCHADVTMKNQFRPDYTSFHVVVYNDKSGERLAGYTHQGFADETMWARGQAWGIYGYTMTYRETKNNIYLDFAQKIADVYLSRLPEDKVPYWDFDAPKIPIEPKDASAAAITASALLELSTYIEEKAKADYYFDQAEAILISLSSSNYQSGDKKSSFLLHCTGHKPNGTEIDASINYADYYYIEALMRYKKLSEGGNSIELTGR